MADMNPTTTTPLAGLGKNLDFADHNRLFGSLERVYALAMGMGALGKEGGFQEGNFIYELAQAVENEIFELRQKLEGEEEEEDEVASGEAARREDLSALMREMTAAQEAKVVEYAQYIAWRSGKAATE